MTGTVAKYRALTEKLYERTIAKKLKWRYEGEDRSVWVRLAGQTILLSISSNDDFEPLCSLSIQNNEGEFLEGFNDENLGPEKPAIGNFLNWYLLMEAMFQMAKRQATGADEALDNILRELDASSDWDNVEF